MTYQKGDKVEILDKDFGDTGTVVMIQLDGAYIVRNESHEEWILEHTDISSIQTAASPSTRKSWRDDPATEKQIGYLASLGVDGNLTSLTKGQASELIDAAKSDTLGSMNAWYIDGSN